MHTPTVNLPEAVHHAYEDVRRCPTCECETLYADLVARLSDVVGLPGYVVHVFECPVCGTRYKRTVPKSIAAAKGR